MSGGARRLLVPLWLGLAILTTLPYLSAWLWPPPGQHFTGAIFYPDDFFQYLSFAEQAQRGRFLFVNKFDPRPHEPILANLEWWSAGLLGRWLGGAALGFQFLRLAALAALLAACHGLLTLCGRTGPARAWGVVLVTTGGGLGWLRLASGAPGWQIPDILMGLYPWHQALLNAHFVIGTALLAVSLVLYLRWRAGGAPRWPWLGSAWLLGLSRPYDLATFVVAVGASELWQAHREGRQPLGRALELAWLAPLLGYYALIVARHPSFAGWSLQPGDLSPPLIEYAFALGPGAVLVGLFGRAKREPTARPVLVLLCSWCLSLLAVLTFWDSPMAKQYATSLGAALLLWAAAVTPERLLPWAVLALSPTSLFMLWRALNPFPTSFVPGDYLAAVRYLRTACAPGQLALAPTDLSLMIGGLTPCHVAVGHRLLTPRFASEVSDVTRFYDELTPVSWRLAYLRARRVAFVALPAGRVGWLGGTPAFQRVLTRPLLELFVAGAVDAGDERRAVRPARRPAP